jgi:hypothetical protein
MTEIVERATKDLVLYARNPLKNDAVVDQMAASIREFGFKMPILALVGEGRCLVRIVLHEQLGIHF